MSRLVVLAAIPESVELGQTIVQASPLTMRGYATLEHAIQASKPGAKIHDPDGQRLLFEAEDLQRLLLSLVLSPNHPEIQSEPGLLEQLHQVMTPGQYASLVGVAFRAGGPKAKRSAQGSAGPSQDESSG